MADLLIVLAFAVPGLLVAGLAFAVAHWGRVRGR